MLHALNSFQVTRVRRVKCDELYPACMRCCTTGRTCDGYNFLTTVSESKGFQGRKENRYFDYFRHNTLAALTGFDPKSGFWSSVLQVAHSYPAVLHAVLALSALHEHLNTGPASREESGSSTLFLKHYNKSIGCLRSLRSDQTPQPLQVTLTCCILFVCLENAQGNHDIALRHLRSGLRILGNIKADCVRPTSCDDVPSSMIRVFRRLDMQATVFLDSRRPELEATLLGNELMATTHSLSFQDLREAQESLEDIEVQMLNVLTTALSRKQGPGPRLEMLSLGRPLFEALSSRFGQWKEAFDALSIREREIMQTEDLQFGVLLALHYQTTSLMLDVRAELDLDTGHGPCSREFRFTRINELSRSLIHSTPSSESFRLSAATGVIAPLYFSAQDAPTSQIRQQAIDLLHQVKWKEGFWDAGTAAKIAENVNRVRTLGNPRIPITGGIPDLAKAHCVRCR